MTIILEEYNKEWINDLVSKQRLYPKIIKDFDWLDKHGEPPRVPSGRWAGTDDLLPEAIYCIEALLQAGVIYLSANSIINFQAGLDLLINLISEYLGSKFFKEKSKASTVKLTILFDTVNGNVKKLEFKGDKNSIKELPKIIRELFNT